MAKIFSYPDENNNARIHPWQLGELITAKLLSIYFQFNVSMKACPCMTWKIRQVTHVVLGSLLSYVSVVFHIIWNLGGIRFST